MSWVYGSERVDAQALDELEVVLRHVADELAAWRARALKAEGDLKTREPAPSGARGRPERSEGPQSRRDKDLLEENDVLRRRVEAARVRVQELMGRLSFLEEQAGNGNGGTAGSLGGGARR